MTVLTGEDLANLTGTTPSPQTGNIVIEADTFIGDLQGNATTADKLAKEFTLVVEGDVHGSVTTDGSKDKVLNTTVSHADHSDVSDYTEQSKLSERASLADLANLATYALESAKSRLADLAIESEHATESDHSINADKALQADKASESDHAVRADNATHSDSADKDGQGNVITDTYARDNAVLHLIDYARQVNVTGLAKGEGRVNRTSIDIVISELARDELQLFVFSPLPAEDADTTKIYVSQEEKQFYLYDTATLTWVNLFDTYNVAIADLENKLNDGLESAQSSIQALSDKVDTDIQDLSDDVDSRLSALSGELREDITAVDDKVDSLTETVTDTYATKEYSDGNLDSAKSYTDTKLETYATKEYSDQNLETSKDYTDTQISELATKQYVDENQSSGLNLFDVVAKDHVLTYGKDLEGFAPLGTWVYKTAVDGSRYGYPDFVQKCLDEYDEATDDVLGIPFAQPILSANGTLGGDSFALSSSTIFSVYYTYYPFSSVANTSQGYSWVTAGNSGYYIIYNPTVLKITNIHITNRNESSSRAITNGTVYGSNNGTDWTEITTFTNSVTAQLCEWDINLSSNTDFYKYYKLEVTNSDSYIGIGKIVLTAYEQLNVKRHSNGHIYFDVTDIDKVNAYFNTYNHAWFYGIDETNERVFLPRQAHGKLIESYKNGTDWYRIYEDGFCVQGGRIPASNDGEYHSGTISLLKPFTDSNYNCFITSSGNDGTSYALMQTNRTNSTFSYGHVVTRYGADWIALGYISLANVEVTPSYEYMVVGNVTVQQSSTEVIDVTTTNNDTVPLFAPHYFDYTPNNLSWLKGGEQSNSGDLYKTCYNELVNVLNGETKYGALKVIDQADMVSGTDYSLYWIVNQTTETFRTPTKTQQRFVIKTYQNGTDWYRIYSDGWCEQGGYIDDVGSSTERTIQLFIPYKYADYNVTITDGYRSGAGSNNSAIRSCTTGSFNAYFNSYYEWWNACGYIDLSNETFDTALYFKVANAVENIQMLDVGEMTEALSGKVDNTNTAWATNACMPDYSAGISINMTTAYQSYTCPSDGVVVIGGTITNDSTNASLIINGTTVGFGYNAGSGSYNCCCNAQFIVSKDDICQFKTQLAGQATFTFYPCKGV